MDRILQAAESSCGVSALTGEETALENRDYEKILNAMPETGVYVIREDNHGLLYFNKRVQQLSPEAQPGMSCRQVWTGSCANCPLRTVKGRNESRSLSYNALFGGVVDMTAARILWEDAIPAFMVTVTPRIEAASYIYQKILRINLSQNRYDVLKSDESVWLSEAGSENLSAELQQFTAGDIVHPDDLNRIASFTNPKHLQEALSSGRTMLTCAYRRRHNGTFRRVLIEAVRGFDYSPENQTAIFCVKDVQDAMQEDLDLEETPKDVQIQTLQDRAYIISSLSSLFFSTYYINLENDTFRTVIQLSKIGDVLGSEVNCTAAFQVYDVDGNMAQPDRGFKLTLEMLRRKPDSALIWYEDFRDENPLPESYWTTLSGKWEVWREGYENRPYSQLEGSGQLAWKYSGFSDIHLRARLAFPAGGSGKAGVFCGDVFCCLNYDTQRVELYKGSTLLGSYSQTISRTANADLRGNPAMYTVEMRIRGNRVRVYSGASYALRFTASISGFSGGYAGYRSDNRTVCELMRLGDSWTYEPYERFDVRMPDGSFKSFGRISRSNVAWDEEFQVFTLTADVEESATRSEDISMDYDFFHSDLMEISCGNNYTAEVTPRDINIWISRLFLGDADGFSILYYQDVDSLVYWANQAAYRWKLRGMCMWSLGQEDMRIWEWLPKQI